MYRDEILAIGEAVLEAAEKGARAVNQELRPHVSSLERVVEQLLRFTRGAEATRMVAIQAEPEDEAENVRILREALNVANGRLEKIRSEAEKAIRNSGVLRIQRKNFDSEVPF